MTVNGRNLVDKKDGVDHHTIDDLKNIVLTPCLQEYVKKKTVVNTDFNFFFAVWLQNNN